MRSAALCQLSTLPLPLLIQYIYPKLYSLHDMPDNAGLPDENTGDIVLPPPSNLSSASLVPYGLYLIDDGQTQFLWVGRDVVPQLVEDVFAIPDRTQVKVGKQTLPVLENDFNERVRAVVEKSRDHRSRGVGSVIVPHLYVVREDGEPGMRLWAQTMLVEDRADQGASLKQWLGVMREKVSDGLLTVPQWAIVANTSRRSYNDRLHVEINFSALFKVIRSSPLYYIPSSGQIVSV